jgi:glutamate/tyrosine decarboxylase-like PLP-dependent enzyme
LFESTTSLDPSDWSSLRAQSHRMLDGMLDYVQQIRERPVWQPAPEATEALFQTPLPRDAGTLQAAYQCFHEHVLPYAIGNAHPGFMGWAHGGGSVVGMLAEMLAAGLNANLGGRDHIPIAVEQQVVAWMRELFRFPQSASGLFVTGSSMANFIGSLIARTAALGVGVRATGLPAASGDLVAYASTAAHGCIAQALELGGIGSDRLRRIPVDRQQRMNLDALSEAIVRDQRAGHRPYCVFGSAGTVDVGAIDDLSGIAQIADREGLWFHVDGACGALGMLSDKIAPKLSGIELADSLALDFHKWGQVPYDAGFILVRDSELHQATFAAPAAYLRRESRGMAAGSPWPCDFGPDLSRSFKALKVWFTFQVFGAQRLGQMMDRTCELARYLESRIRQSDQLELLAPVSLNIVCFRYRCLNADRVNARIVVDLQESGLSAPSSTSIDGQIAIRAAIFNHRTAHSDVDRLVDAVLRFGSAQQSSSSS